MRHFIAATLLMSAPALADPPSIENVTYANGRFDVTLLHADTAFANCTTPMSMNNRSHAHWAGSLCPMAQAKFWCARGPMYRVGPSRSLWTSAASYRRPSRNQAATANIADSSKNNHAGTKVVRVTSVVT